MLVSCLTNIFQVRLNEIKSSPCKELQAQMNATEYFLHNNFFTQSKCVLIKFIHSKHDRQTQLLK